MLCLHCKSAGTQDKTSKSPCNINQCASLSHTQVAVIYARFYFKSFFSLSLLLLPLCSIVSPTRLHRWNSSHWMACNMLLGVLVWHREREWYVWCTIILSRCKRTPNAMTSMDFSRAQSTGRNHFVSSHRIRPPHQHETPFNLFIAPRIVYEAVYAVTVFVAVAAVVASKIRIPFPSLLERSARVLLMFLFRSIVYIHFLHGKKYNQKPQCWCPSPIAIAVAVSSVDVKRKTLLESRQYDLHTHISGMSELIRITNVRESHTALSCHHFNHFYISHEN